jgi:DNA polymerase V
LTTIQPICFSTAHKHQYSTYQFAGNKPISKNLQKAELEIKKRFGKNAIMRGISLEKGATAKERNDQIGGHKA